MPTNQMFWYGLSALIPALLAMVTIATKGGLQYLSAEWFVCFMFMLSLPFLVPWDRKKLLAGWSRRALVPFAGHTVCIGIAWLLYTIGVGMMPAALAVFVSRIESIFIIVLAVIFLKEPFGKVLMIAAALSFLGIALIDGAALSGDTAAPFRAGILYLVVGALFFAAGEIFAAKTLVYLSPAVITFFRNLFLAFVFLGIAVRGGPLDPKMLAAALPWAAAAAVCGPVIARVLHLHCIKHIPLSHAAVMTNTEPVFGVLLGFLFFSEMPDAAQNIGAFLICAGIILSILQQKCIKLSLNIDPK